MTTIWTVCEVSGGMDFRINHIYSYLRVFHVWPRVSLMNQAQSRELNSERPRQTEPNRKTVLAALQGDVAATGPETEDLVRLKTSYLNMSHLSRQIEGRSL